MNGLTKVLATIIFGIIVIVSTAVGAYETGERQWSLGKKLSLGNGIMDKMGHFTGGDAESFNVPLLFQQGNRFFIEDTTLKFQLIEWNNFAVGTIGKYRFEVFNESERDLLNGLEERDDVLDVGLNIDFATKYGVLGIDLLTDALGAENGQKVDISWKKAFNANR